MNRMSDDLISRKALLEVLNKRLADYSCDSNSGAQRIADIYKYELIPVVENAPTAFDKEKVIEKLKRLEKDTFDYYNRYNDEMAFGESAAFRSAIEIVAESCEFERCVKDR